MLTNATSSHRSELNSGTVCPHTYSIFKSPCFMWWTLHPYFEGTSIVRCTPNNNNSFRMWSTIWSWAASVHSEVNSIAEWTAVNNYSSLMCASMLSRAASIYSEVNSSAERTPANNASLLIWSSILSRTASIHSEVNSTTEWTLFNKNWSSLMWCSIMSSAAKPLLWSEFNCWMDIW